MTANAGSAGAPGDATLADRLLAWYDAGDRDVPWRGERDPFRILVAEVMAQQTRIETVGPYYRRFTARFPSAEALADAELDEVLKLWEGLGYYARARRLHAAARQMVRERGGRVPETVPELRRLPGVGAYTAGAVASLAFGRSEPAIDGNVRRVLARLHDMADPGPAELEDRARELLEDAGDRPGAMNQALMDLGSRVCLPRRPRCGSCPVSRDCLARARETIPSRPARAPRSPTPLRHRAAARVRRGEAILVLRRPEDGLLGGLWDLPGVPLAENADSGRVAEALAADLSDRLGLIVDVGEKVRTVDHAFSHFRLRLLVHEAAWRSGELGADGSARWAVPRDLEDLAFPAYCRSLLPKEPSGDAG